MTLQARPTRYKGIQMRSRLEACVASWFDAHKMRWSYEGDAYADETGQYLPDFRLPMVWLCGRPRLVFVEVKGAGLLWGHVADVLDRMAIIWSTLPHAALVIVSPDDETFHEFALRYKDGTRVVNARDGWWLVCEGCELVAVETMSRIGGAFDGRAEPWRCPTCQRNAGFNLENIWFSDQYYSLAHGHQSA